ncbi:hypothetical protein EIN_030860 [Entamoeba invadens IP1]|uniref:Uncharacterized protein n=1 Tax=Entamoeba invadens IP1 TaxID=370355 RepID=A0A0A1TY37_ENTIV|nr:hypothetical protein EIN_030860 [Entamoeba invadens IP1]ELP86405.1 hypothetical protein EIN_030860 [Entamoeba invadens IP1]|eukprot:XP_004185751.1 hypothetical protein EIN_030860 [Entamoeba invadens IP1]
MIVLKYFSTVDVLRRFNFVSRNAQTAIDATKVNPCCGIASIELAITLGTTRMQRVEMKVFKHLDTFKVHFRELEHMDKAQLEKYPMIEIYKYIMRDRQEDCKVAFEIKDKISVIGIDTTYAINFELVKMPMLRELTLRIGDNPNQVVLKDAFDAIQTNVSLRKCVIKFPSTMIQEIIDKCVSHQERIKFTFIITIFDDAHAEQVQELIRRSKTPIGICDTLLNEFQEFFLLKEKVVLVPHVNKYFRTSKAMRLDSRIAELRNLYLPVREEEL